MRKCKICGRYSYYHELCNTCYSKTLNGDSYDYEKNEWNRIRCFGKTFLPKHKEKINCILCGESISEGHICKNCNEQYQNETIMLELENCETFTIINDI